MRSVKENLSRQLLDLEILFLLSSAPRTGYGLRRELSRAFQLDISYGTLYPHLYNLEERDLVIGKWGSDILSRTARKRMYHLSEQGDAYLRESVTWFSAIIQKMRPKLVAKITAAQVETAQE